MTAPRFLSIVIPSYNEVRRLPATLETIGAYLGRRSFTSEVLVVDDGGTAGAADLAAGCAGADVIRVRCNDWHGVYCTNVNILIGRYYRVDRSVLE